VGLDSGGCPEWTPVCLRLSGAIAEVERPITELSSSSHLRQGSQLPGWPDPVARWRSGYVIQPGRGSGARLMYLPITGDLCEVQLSTNPPGFQIGIFLASISFPVELQTPVRIRDRVILDVWNSLCKSQDA
jgi:hypothetical protein